MSHDIRWYSPAPLWPKRLQNGTGDRLQRPELLQFEQDDFMAELQTTLEDPEKALDEKRAEGEKHLGRNGTTEPVEGPIPLYQPAHERYYLVTATLVCRERGLPDRAVDTANEEKVAFVLRRLERADSDASKGLLSGEDKVNPVEVNGTEYVEYAWMGNETTAKEEEGASGNGKKTAEKNWEWRPLKEPKERVPEKEERLSMFPKNYEPTTRVEAMKGPRRLWAGLIPVAKRDTYETAPVRYEPVSTEANSSDQEDEVPSQLSTLEESDDDLSDPRKTKFTTRVIRPFYQLRERLGKADDLPVEDVRAPFLFAWLDLWQFLNTHLGDVVTEIKSDTSQGAVDFVEGDPKSDAKLNLHRWLHSTELQDLGLGDSPASVLCSIRDSADDIEGGYLEEVGDLNLENNGDTLNRSALKETLNTLLSPNEQGESLTEVRPDLQKKVFGALEALTDAEPLPDDLQPPTSADPGGGGAFVVRCLYERPNCPEPMRTQVSERSIPFRLASFFDSKAPARDINITMPGVSLQELRNSSQSATMVFTTELSNQATKIQEVVFEELGANGDAQTIDLGRVCSLSIPIITICALVLLLVIVIVLNIVFWWLPFFKICFPLPSSDS